MPAGNSLATATLLNLSSTPQSFPDSVTQTANDYYRFSLAYRSSFSLSLTNLSADANVEVLNSSGQPLTIDGTALSSTNPGNFSESIHSVLDRGTYYIRVSPGATVTTADYTLNLAIDTNLISNLLWRNYQTGDNAVWFLNGTQLVSTTNLTNVANLNWRIQGTGDFNNDGNTDIVWRNYQTGDNAVWFLNGTQLASTLNIRSVANLNWQIQGTGDFNNDGNTDLVWRNYQTGDNAVWFLNGTQLVSTTNLTNVSNLNWRIQGTGDFNNDGNTDIVWRNYQTGDNAVWFLNGSQFYQAQNLTNVTNLNWQIQGTGDFNQDGNTDLVWRNYQTGDNAVWFLNGTQFYAVGSLTNVANSNWRVISPFLQQGGPRPIDAAGNTLAAAFNLGSNLSGTGNIAGALAGTTDTDDYYRFTLNARSNLSLSLAGLTSNADLALFSATGTQLGQSAQPNLTPEAIATIVDAGTYYVRVNRVAGDTPYTLSLDINNFPVLATNLGLSLNEGASSTITSSVLRVTDADNPDTELTYTLSSVPTYGGLTIGGLVLTTGDTFTQAELDTGLTYSHNGSEQISDRFTFTVSDGAGGTLNLNTFSIAVTPVNDPPLLVSNTGVSVNEGEAVSITSTVLQVSDVDTPPNQVIYTIGAIPVNGSFSRNGVALTRGSTFTQADFASSGLLYSHNGSETASDRFTFTASDGVGGVLSTSTFTITVNPVNDAPVLTVPAAAVAADQGANVAISGISVTDPDAETVSVTLTVTNGALSLGSKTGLTLLQGTGTGDRTLVFSGSQAAVNFALRSLTYKGTTRGADTLTVIVNDNGSFGLGGPLSDRGTVGISVSPVNQAPTISLPATQLAVNEDSGLALSGLSIIDPDAGGGTMRVSLFAVNGSLSLPAGAGVTLVTGDGTQDKALVFDGPLALINSALNRLVYQGDLNFNGSDIVTISVSDNGNTGNGGPLSDTQTLSLTVNPVNDRPSITAPTAATALENVDLRLNGISITDVDAGSGTLTVNLAASNGILTLGSTDGVQISTTNGSQNVIFAGTLAAIDTALSSLTYRSNPDFNGSDTLTIDVNDGGNTGSGITLSDSKTVSLTIQGVNSRPVITLPNVQQLETNAGDRLSVPGISVTDPDAGAGTVTLSVSANNGVLSLGSTTGLTFLQGSATEASARLTVQGSLGAINGALGTLTYQGNYNTQGYLDAINISISDNGNTGIGPALSDNQRLIVNVGGAVNQAPIATSNIYNARRNGVLSVSAAQGVLSDDTDPEGFPLVAILSQDAANGTVSLNSDGSFTYRSLPGFSGVDSFTYLANDGLSDSTPATVLLTVSNSAPIANSDPPYATSRNTSLSVTAANGVLRNDSDPEGDPLTAIPLTTVGATGGSLSLGSDGSFVYTPAANAIGVDTFLYQVSDGTLTSGTATVTVSVATGVNLAPSVVLATTPLAYTEGDASVAIDAALTVTDVDSPSLTGATVAISSGFTSGQDTLTFVNQSGITGTYNSTTGVLRLNGRAPLAAYQSVLQSVAYSNSSTNPSGTSRVFSITVNDGNAVNGLGSAFRTLSLTAVNDPPVAVNDGGYVAVANTPLTVTAANQRVLSNDTDPEGSPLTATLLTPLGSSGGSLSLGSDGSFVYTPTATFTSGVESFTYQASDGQLASNTATIVISVGSSTTVTTTVNTAPTAANDTSYSTSANVPLSVTLPSQGVLNNDTDAQTPSLSLTATALSTVGTSGGTINLNPNGTFVYRPPNATFTGSDSFTYQASDGQLASNTATIVISVGSSTTVTTTVNTAPTAANDTSYSTSANVPLSVTLPSQGVLNNDTDAETGPLSLTATALSTVGTSGGTINLNPNGTFVYRPPNATFTGSDSFTYQASDGQLTSNPATIVISVGSSTTVTTTVNTAPTAVNDLTYSTTRNRPLTVTASTNGVLNNDRDTEQLTLTAVPLTTVNSAGTLDLSPDGSFVYTPASSFAGNASFTYLANDGTLNSANTGTIVISVAQGTNQAPIAVNDTAAGQYSTPVNTPLTVGFSNSVLRNDSDPENDPLTPIVVTSTRNGALSLNSDGTFIYQPSSTFTGGVDSFTYRVSDGLDSSGTATVLITVVANTAPVAGDDLQYVTAQNVPLSITAGFGDVLTNDTDAETPGSLTVLPLSTISSNGTLALNQDGSFTYRPNSGFVGVDSFTYQVSDGQLSSNTATIAISVTGNAPPSASDDSYSALAGQPLTVDAFNSILLNDQDAESSNLSAIGIRTVSPTGTLTLSSNGNFVYRPNAGFTSGVDSFTYVASDGTNQSNTATIFITVQPG